MIAAAPLLLFALLGYRGAPKDTLELLLRAWVPAAVVIWLFALTPLGATPLHAVGGLPLPMAVLAVRGVHRAGLDRLPRARLLAWLAIVVVTVPATAYTMEYAHTFIEPASDSGDYIAPARAPRSGISPAAGCPGGCCTVLRLGQPVPGGHGACAPTVGDCLWSEPRCTRARARPTRCSRARMAPAAARRFVASSGARFVLGELRAAPRT